MFWKTLWVSDPSVFRGCCCLEWLCLSFVWLFVSSLCPKANPVLNGNESKTAALDVQRGNLREGGPWPWWKQVPGMRHTSKLGCRALWLSWLLPKPGVPRDSSKCLIHQISLPTTLVGCTWCCILWGKLCDIVLVGQTWLHGNGASLVSPLCHSGGRVIVLTPKPGH